MSENVEAEPQIVEDESDDRYMETFRASIMDPNIEIQLRALHSLTNFARLLDKSTIQVKLIPFLLTNLGDVIDEGAVILAEKLQYFTQYFDDFNPLLELLVELAKNEEELVRRQTMFTLRKVTALMTSEQCEAFYQRFIANLFDLEWWNTRCSASNIATIIYTKLSLPTREKVRAILKICLQDDATIVRLSIIQDYVRLVDSVEMEVIWSEYILIFQNLTHDIEELIREVTIQFGLAIALKLNDLTPVVEIFERIADDCSWKVRLRLAACLHKLLPLARGLKQLTALVEINTKFVHDEQNSIRVQTTKNLHKFASGYFEAYRQEPEYDEESSLKFFIETIKSWIDEFLKDEEKEVRLALSDNILLFGSSISNDWFLVHILPILIHALETESVQFRENIVRNINQMPEQVDICKVFPAIEKFISKLMLESSSSWRPRRNLLLVINQVMKKTPVDLFNIEIKDYYVQLLYDPVFSVRRTAPVILPCLIQRFGFNWAKEYILPKVITLGKVDNYLFRLMPMFTILELIQPSIDLRHRKQQTASFFTDIKTIVDQNPESKQFKRVLTKIVILCVRLSKELESDDFNAIVQKSDEELAFPNDDLKCYGEETLESLQASHQLEAFRFIENNLSEPSYMEGLLLFLIRDCFHVLKVFLHDKTENVRARAEFTIKQLYNFSEELHKEVKQAWIGDILNEANEELLAEINKEIFMALEKGILVDKEYLEFFATRPGPVPSACTGFPINNAFDNMDIPYISDEFSFDDATSAEHKGTVEGDKLVETKEPLNTEETIGEEVDDSTVKEKVLTCTKTAVDDYTIIKPKSEPEVIEPIESKGEPLEDNQEIVNKTQTGQ